HVFGREAVLRQALTKILRDKAEYFLLHVDGVTLRERNVDPGTDEKVHEAAGFGNQFALDHLFRADPEGFPENGEHTRMATDRRRRELLADLLRDTIFQLGVLFTNINKFCTQ